MDRWMVVVRDNGVDDGLGGGLKIWNHVCISQKKNGSNEKTTLIVGFLEKILPNLD